MWSGTPGSQVSWDHAAPLHARCSGTTDLAAVPRQHGVVASRGRGQVGFELTPCVSQTEFAHRAARPRDATFIDPLYILRTVNR